MNITDANYDSKVLAGMITLYFKTRIDNDNNFKPGAEYFTVDSEGEMKVLLESVLRDMIDCI